MRLIATALPVAATAGCFMGFFFYDSYIALNSGILGVGLSLVVANHFYDFR